MKHYLITHSRGNHTPEQVFNHGKIHIEGTAKECRAELVRMRKFCRDKWYTTSTNQKMTEFVNYEMGDVFFVKVDGSIINWA